MPDRKDNEPDVSQSAVRAVEEIGGIEPLEDGAELIGNPKLRQKYREAMERDCGDKGPKRPIAVNRKRLR